MELNLERSVWCNSAQPFLFYSSFIDRWAARKMRVIERRPIVGAKNNRPHVVVLGTNFAGLACSQKIRKYAGDAIRITVIDQKSYLLYIPNISADFFEDPNAALRQRLDVVPILAKDDVDFIHGEVIGVDIDKRSVKFRPAERSGRRNS
jgi:hypothetical protein